MLVYARDSASCNHPIVAAADDGSHARVVSAGGFPQVAPDGRLVVFIRCTSRHRDDLYAAAVRGGPARLLARDVDLPTDWGPHSWSPDSGSVLVLNAADDRVLVVDVRRDQRRVLRLDPGAQLDGASFSPDAAEIVLAESEADGDGNSLVLATRTGTRRLGAFGHTVGLPVWGPQGLADVQRGASVQLRPSIAAPPRTIFLGGDGENLAPLAWSGDGRVLLVRSVTLDLASEPNLPQAILISPSTGRSTAIRGYTEIYDVSADGASVLAQLGRDVVSARTGGVDATVAVSAQSASWSRRG